MIIRHTLMFLTHNLDVVLDVANVTPDGGCIFIFIFVKITESMHIV